MICSPLYLLMCSKAKGSVICRPAGVSVEEAPIVIFTHCPKTVGTRKKKKRYFNCKLKILKIVLSGESCMFPATVSADSNGRCSRHL